MKKPENIWLILIFLIAILVYFVSEALMRQATVSRINPDAVKVDEIISDLPADLQQKIQQRMIMTRLRQQLHYAETPAEQVKAMQTIAIFTEDKEERIEMHEQVVKKFPLEPDAYASYCFFMLNEDVSLNRISMKQFHDYQKQLPPEERYFIWTNLYNKWQTQTTPPGDAETMHFLMPLLEIHDPAFSEYFTLFDELAKYAALTGDKETAEKAAALAKKCSYKRSFDDFLKLREEEKVFKAKLRAKQSGVKEQ